jgi:hypothetical protein
MKPTRVTVVALMSAAILTGCGIGFNAGTQTIKPAANGAIAANDSLQLRAGNLVVDKNRPTTALFVGTLINPTDSDTVLSGLGADPAVVAAATIDGTANLPAGIPVQFGYNDGHNVLLVSATGGFTPGTYVTVRFELLSGEPLIAKLLVNTNEGNFSDVVVPTAAPTASPEPVASGEPTPMPSAS